MIHFVEQKDIRKLKWDECIRRSQFPSIYALSWYLDVVSPGWCALVEDDYSAVMPLPLASKLGLTYSLHPFYTQQLGLFHRAGERYNIGTFIKAIPKNIRFINIHLNESNRIHGKFISYSKNYLLNLSPTYLDIRSNYSPYTRRNLKKFEESVLHVEENIAVRDLVGFMLRHPVAKTLTANAKLTYRLFETVEQYKQGQSFGVRDSKGSLIGVLYILNSFQRYINMLETTNEIGRENRVMFGLLDYFIKKNSNNSMLLDFEGSNMEGVAKFFEGFGAYPTRYPVLRINRLPWFIHWLKSNNK